MSTTHHAIYKFEALDRNAAIKDLRKGVHAMYFMDESSRLLEQLNEGEVAMLEEGRIKRGTIYENGVWYSYYAFTIVAHENFPVDEVE